MYRVPRRLVHALAVSLSASLLLAGCMAGPTGLGGSMYRSLKDTPAPEAPPAVARAPKRVRAKLPATTSAPRPLPRLAKKRPPALPGCGSDKACIAQLKNLVDNPNRDWIGKPLPTAEYANGTRLFAYRALRPQLTCEQLLAATADTQRARQAFSAPVSGVTTKLAKRVVTLSAAVERELQTEAEKRCKT